MVSEKQRAELINAACEVRRRAYSPYSQYQVGAAILTDEGQIFTGVNVENASYGLSICAERTAVFSAVTAGMRRILAAAVCTENAGPPCGACRQVLSEFAGDVPIWLIDRGGNVQEASLYALLPECFGPEDLVP